MKRVLSFCLMIALVAGVGMCPAWALAESAVLTVDAAAAETAAMTATLPDVSEMFTDRDREGDYEDYVTVELADGASRTDGSGVTIDGDVITITGEGTYLFTGTLTDGQILVNAGDEDKVQVVLSGAHITRKGGAALYVLDGDKIFLTLAEGTENSLASAGEFVRQDDNTVDATIYSKSDITLNGTGAAVITCETGHGVAAKDDLKVTGGVWTVDAYAKGLEANDSFRMAGGEISITAGADGIQVENEEDLSRGYVYIEDGALHVESVGDAVSATGVLHVAGGMLRLATTDTVDSAKGLKSDNRVEITGGTISMITADDGIHTNGSTLISGGDITIYSGDDGIHSDATTEITGGSVIVPASYEGIEGANVLISGGYISVVTTDDGINAGGGADGSGFGGRGSSFAAGASACNVTISGGEVYVNAEGDGLDANGSLYITGGQVTVYGPTTSFNGTLDFDGSAVVSGGVVVATGPNSWLQNFGTESTQGSILCTFSSNLAPGTEITVTDNATGQVIVSCTAEKYFQSVIISSPELVVGGSYTITAGEESQTIEMTSLIYGGGFGSMGGGKSGRSGKGGRG